MNDRTATEIEEVFAFPSIASLSPLPSANMGQRMLNGYSFAQLGSPLRRRLPLAQLDEQGFIRVDAYAASLGTGGALSLQGALSISTKSTRPA